MTKADDLDRFVRFYETLTPSSLGQLGSVYAENVRFKDPFNDVDGLLAVVQIFEQMFDRFSAPDFQVNCKAASNGHGFVTWRFSGATSHRKTEKLTIYGATHISFDERGLVRYHRDYWDPTEELYEKIPVIRALSRGIKRLTKM